MTQAARTQPPPGPHAIRIAIAREVKSLMGRDDVPQKDLAAYLGMSQPSLSKRLSGKKSWTVDEVEAMARYFNQPVSRLLGESLMACSSDNAGHALDLVQSGVLGQMHLPFDTGMPGPTGIAAWARETVDWLLNPGVKVLVG